VLHGSQLFVAEYRTTMKSVWQEEPVSRKSALLVWVSSARARYFPEDTAYTELFMGSVSINY
jgi:hypothetical protein